MQRKLTLSLLIATAVTAQACQKNSQPIQLAAPPAQSAASAATAPTANAATKPAMGDLDVAAMVNGVPILRDEVRIFLRSRTRGDTSPPPEMEDQVLELLINQEIMAQYAQQKGLELEGKDKAEWQKMMAAASGFRRQSLAEVAKRDSLKTAPEVSPDDVQAYFKEHETELKTEWHMEQIMGREEAPLQGYLADLKAGKSFEEVAKASLGGEMPAAGLKPWDLGWLHWKQLPDPWRPEVTKLKPGQFSEVVHGAKHRYWIVRVVETRAAQLPPKADFEAMLADDLKNERALAGNQKLEMALRQKAQVVRMPRPPAAPGIPHGATPADKEHEAP